MVEDDEAMGVALKDGFAYEGYEVVLATTGAEGLRLARQSRPELVILDVMLPGVSGFDVCKSLRAEGNNVPIIMLTARGPGDRQGGRPAPRGRRLRHQAVRLHGAAGPRRGRAAARRRRRRRPRDVGLLHLRRRDRRPRPPRGAPGRRRLDLTTRELKLLGFLIRHRGEVITRDQLLDAVWGYTSIPFTRTVDAHVARLRKKIEDAPEDPRFIVTVHRLGYKFAG